MSWVNRVLDAAQSAEADQLVKRGFPESTANKIASGELPMDEASRMARAKQMGFDTDTTYYHGTAVDIPKFDMSYAGGSTQAKSAKLGAWLSDSPMTAEGYADLAAEKPVQDLINQSYSAERSGDFNLAERLVRQAEELEASGGSGQNILPVYTTGSVKKIDMDGAQYDPDDINLSDMASSAKVEGYESLRLQDFSDEAGYGVYNPVNHQVVFNPNKIRSKYAAFDPDQAESGNLLALTGKNQSLVKRGIEGLNPQAIGTGGSQAQAPTQRPTEQFGDWTTRVLEGVVSPKMADTLGRHAATASQFTPMGWAADGGYNIAEAVDKGELTADAAFSLLDFIPGIGGATKQGAKQIFAGAKAAKNLGKLDDMKKAEKMLADGADEREVWNQTGFFKGDDGLMRFEIDDRDAITKLDASASAKAAGDGGIYTSKGTYQYGFGGKNESLMDYLESIANKIDGKEFKIDKANVAATGVKVKRVK